MLVICGRWLEALLVFLIFSSLASTESKLFNIPCDPGGATHIAR